MKKTRFTIDHKSPVPLHAQVEQLFREMIDLHDLPDKTLFPNEAKLAQELGTSRNTVRQALNKLVIEGLLIRKKGVGTFVADRSVATRINNWLSFSQEMAAKGIRIRNFALDIEWVEADKVISGFFNIKPGKKVLKLERLRGSENHPFVFFVSYFHPRIGLTGNEDFSRPLYDILEKDHSVVVKLSKEEISACAADEAIAEKLWIKPGDPILQRKRFVFDPGGRAVEYNLGFYRADSFIYTIESEREF
ncbi:MAG: GntR family transcriptional regulator [Bacteroidales bacterium]|nr:GntR family transcriptional regulator [Bacteroidales bacterium]